MGVHVPIGTLSMHMDNIWIVYGVELETQVSLERAISTGDMCRGALSRITM